MAIIVLVLYCGYIGVIRIILLVSNWGWIGDISS